ncbi:MAG: hypothetical protein ABI199_07940 [Bacteroidia bacterium]
MSHFIGYAQEDKDATTSKYPTDWTDIGVGNASTDFFKTKSNDANFVLDYNRAIDKMYFELGINGNILTTTPYLSTINLDIGDRLFSRYYLLSGFVGPAYMWGDKTDSGNHFSTIGINTTIQIIGKPLKDFGIGIELYSNWNYIQSNVGFRVVINISSGK